MNNQETGLEIAVIGMSGRYPGADNLEQFWDNLLEGKNAFTHFSDEELRESGVSEDDIRKNNYIKVKPFLDKPFDFDAELFGYTAWEAEQMDPQIRLFHECVYHALEDAGYDPERYDGNIGVYSGASMDMYWMKSILDSRKVSNNLMDTSVVSSKDFISQIISYNMDLTGPSISVSSACSTSLTAVHLACSGLLLGDCNMAIAGGVTINQPEKNGYDYYEGSIYSKDGSLKPYDDDATGTVFGDGGGAVVLKRLSDAIADNDHIYAVILASACNNDGRRKVGFTAPSVESQKELIQTAFEMGEVDPASITFVEGHGTGTNVGDPIEVKALKHAFGLEEKHKCALGSVKGNVGHLNAGAGMASLMKAVLAIKNRVIPPVCQFDKPNEKMDIEDTPFFFNKTPIPLENKEELIRAGISSFGVGGTNVHIILQEYPQSAVKGSSTNNSELLMLSAKNNDALKQMAHNLAVHMNENRSASLCDIAFTLATGRRRYNNILSFVAADIDEAIRVLSDVKKVDELIYTKKQKLERVVFDFSDPDDTAISVDLIKTLYRKPFIKREMDRLSMMIEQITGKGIYHWFDSLSSEYELINSDDKRLLVFAIEYSQALFLQKLGIKPKLLTGKGIGVYTAAAAVGIMEVEEAIKLINDKCFICEEDIRSAELWENTDIEFNYSLGTDKDGYCVLTFVPVSGEMSDTVLGNLDKVLRAGHSIDWQLYYNDSDAYRVALPGYPLQRKCFYPGFLKNMLDKMKNEPGKDVDVHEEKKKSVFKRPESGETPYIPPETETDKIICEVIGEMISMDRIGIRDDLFWLGAHSLAITRILIKLKEIFQAKIPLDEVMEEPTVEAIHRILIRQWNDEATLDQIAMAYREYQTMTV